MRRSGAFWRVLGTLITLVVLTAACGVPADDTTRDLDPADVPFDLLNPEPPTTTTLPQSVETFGNGVWIVGVDIAPGTYRSGEEPDGQPGMCDAARLSGFSGEPEDVIAYKRGYEPFIVTIEATDAGFSSEGCDLWTDDTTPRTSSPTADFHMGHKVVGDEVAPGLWNAGGAEWCLWSRLSGFSWEADDTIAWGAPFLSNTVRIEATDRGFWANEFCSFRYLGP